MLFQLPVVLAYSPVAPLARTAGIFLLAVAVVALAALEASLEQPIENALTEPGAIESIGLPTDQGFRARDCTEAWLVARSLQRKPQSHQSIHATVRDPLRPFVLTRHQGQFTRVQQPFALGRIPRIPSSGASFAPLSPVPEGMAIRTVRLPESIRSLHESMSLLVAPCSSTVGCSLRIAARMRSVRRRARMSSYRESHRAPARKTTFDAMLPALTRLDRHLADRKIEVVPDSLDAWHPFCCDADRTPFVFRLDDAP